jgi:transformation/transcription domain-associated protein
MSTALKLLKVENEENALHCIKIIIDGFRSHKVRRLAAVVGVTFADSTHAENGQEQTEVHVRPFLDLVKQMYANTRQVVEQEFGKPPPVRLSRWPQWTAI